MGLIPDTLHTSLPEYRGYKKISQKVIYLYTSENSSIYIYIFLTTNILLLKIYVENIYVKNIQYIVHLVKEVLIRIFDTAIKQIYQLWSDQTNIYAL